MKFLLTVSVTSIKGLLQCLHKITSEPFLRKRKENTKDLKNENYYMVGLLFEENKI